MANKKKLKNNSNSKAKNTTASNGASSSTTNATAGPQPRPQQPKGILTPGQLAAVILLAMGVSRWMQVGSAMRRSTTTEDEEETTTMTTTMNKAAKNCLDHFIHSAETTVCVDDLVHVWLNFKYMTGLQVMLTTLAMWIRGGCWFNEELLKGFNAMLILTPIVTTVYAFLVPAQDVLVQARIWQQVAMCVVLSFVATPSLSQLPFVNRNLGQSTTTTATRRSASYKTVNSLILMTMVMVQMFQVLAGLGLVKSSSNDYASSSWIPQLPSTTGHEEEEEQAAVASAVKVIHAFWLVDMFTLAAIYFFAWFHLSSDNQKSFLVAVAMVRLTANLVHWPSLIDMQNNLLPGGMVIPVETYQAMDWTITTMGVLGYFAPSTLTWKRKLQ